MRPLEVLLLLANLLAFLVMTVASTGAAQRMRHAPTGALAIALAQVLVEGARWQMTPAYMLAGLFWLLSLRPRLWPAVEPAGAAPCGRLGAALAIGLGLLGLALSAAMPMLIPVFRFPAPTGPFGIGTLTYHWVDSARPELFAADPAQRRALMVQIWYPSRGARSAGHAPYLPDAGAVTSAFARIQRQPEFAFGHFRYVTTHAIGSAPVAPARSGFPVLLFLEGATGFRQMNNFQVEELVSNGYIVVALDQPGAAALVVFPDGRQVAGLSLAQLRAAVGPSYLPRSTPSAPDRVPLPYGRPLQDDSIIPYLAQDVSFTLDRLELLNRSDPNRLLAGKLDLHRVGVFGVSLGGIVAGEACRVERRLRACLAMDAPMPRSVVQAGLQQPGMWITRDAASMRLERQRAGGWPEAEIEAHLGSMRAAYEGVSATGYFVQIRGMFHSNFTDIPNWTVLAERLALAGPIDSRRAHDIVNAYSLAFFDQHLSGQHAGLLDGPASQYPEVLFESRRP